MKTAHFLGSSTVLADGTVFMAGGYSLTCPNMITDRAEIYDPRAGRTIWAGRLPNPRVGATATLLRDGRVLLAGGATTAWMEDPAISAVIFDPANHSFQATGNLNFARRGHADLLLPSGKVLLVGGSGWGRASYSDVKPRQSTEIFDPATGRFNPGPELATAREQPALLLLPVGRILVAGGYLTKQGPVNSTEILDLDKGRSEESARLDIVGIPLALSLQPDGRVLAAGAMKITVLRENPTPAADNRGYTQVFDPATRAVEAPVGPHSRVWHLGSGLALADGGLLLVGGGQRPSGGQIDRLMAGTGAVSPGPELAEATLRMNVHQLPDGRVIALGGLQIRPTMRPTPGVQILE